MICIHHNVADNREYNGPAGLMSVAGQQITYSIITSVYRESPRQLCQKKQVTDKKSLHV